jgi:hypothetical protein
MDEIFIKDQKRKKIFESLLGKYNIYILELSNVKIGSSSDYVNWVKLRN